MKDWWQDNFPQGRQNLIINDSQGYPIQIAYGEKGNGRPLILLHGLGSWSYNWRHSIEPLSRHFRVICCDFKCFGFSEKPVSRREETGHQIIELIGRLVVINAPIFTETLPHWSMGLLAQTPIEIIHAIDDLRLAYWFAPLVREVMGAERRKVLYNPSLLTEEDIYWITYPFIEIPGTLVKVAEELQIAAQEIENLRKNQPSMLKNIQNNRELF